MWGGDTTFCAGPVGLNWRVGTCWRLGIAGVGAVGVTCGVEPVGALRTALD